MQINIKTQQNTDFRLHEGSNYKVLMTYDTSEVISYEAFQKLAQIINNSDVQFVTLNDRIRAKSSIIDISPTKELTPRQRELQLEIRAQNEAAERRKTELEVIKKSFDIEFYNALYGEGAWKPLAIKEDSRRVLTRADREDCWAAFERLRPEEAKEITELGMAAK